MGVDNGRMLAYLAAHGEVRPTGWFAFALEDPVLGRKIAHEYRVRTLPVLG